MGWRTITAGNVMGRLTAPEQAALLAASGSTAKLQERLADAVGAFVGAMSAAGWDVNTDGSVPDQVRNCVMSYAVWEWLKDFPKLDTFKTPERKAAYEDALTDLGKIANRTYGAIEPPAGVNQTGNWNSKPKLIGRTDPHPSPLQQLQIAPAPVNANPNAPTDDVPTNSPGVPQPPASVQAIAVNGTVVVYWTPVAGATGYALYRSTVSGQEITGTNTPVYAQVDGKTTNFTDAAVTSGQPVYYKLAVQNNGLVSQLSNECTATP